MTIVDRYVLKLYLKVFLVCFVSLTGLYVIIETFNNLEEFMELGKQQGSLFKVLGDYFIARAFSFFDRCSHLLALMAAIFTITWLQRSNELTAIMAAGVPQWRVLKPIIAASLFVSLCAMANREIAIPMYKHQLVRNAQTWSGEQAQPMQSRVDYETDFFFSGNQVIPADSKILQPNVHLDRSYPGWGSRINAEEGVFVKADEHHPAGYLLSKIIKPRSLEEAFSIAKDGKTTVYSPNDQDWLNDDQIFIVSNMNFQQLVNGDQLLNYASTLELIENIRNPSQDYGAGLRVTAHNRLLRPLLDISLLLLGLPIVASKRDRNLFVAAGLCVVVIAIFMVTGMLFHSLGSFGIVAPYIGAWGPVAVFVPLAAAAVGTLNQ